MPGQQYDAETGLYYNRYRYYDPQQGRYITQDPIGLRGDWNGYVYPLNPLQKVDPLGLTELGLGGSGADKYCQGISSAVNYLSPEDAKVAIHNNEIMHNVNNPLGEFVYGISVIPAVAGMAVLNAPATSAVVAEKSAACIEDVAKEIIVERNRDSKELTLTCVKSFINKETSTFQSKWSDFLIDSLSSFTQKA